MLKTEEFLYFCQLFVEKGCIFASRFNEQNRKFLKFKDFYFNIKNCPDGGPDEGKPATRMNKVCVACQHI